MARIQQKIDLNQLRACLNKALKIDRQINKRALNEIKIEEIKKIVSSIFKSLNNDNKKN